MTAGTGTPQAAMTWRLLAFAAYLLFVVYGSLVPLDYQPMPFDLAWARFQQIPFLSLDMASRADWVANGVLYAPLAFLAARALAGRGRAGPVAMALSMLFCVAVAVAVEFSQQFFPPRTVSLNDLLAEALGGVVGALAAPLLARWLARIAQAWQAGGARLGPRLLELYAASYLLLCFFPYDLLLSGSELAEKWDSGRWGLWLAVPERGLFFVALQLAVEVVLAVPIGALVAGWHGDVRGRVRPGQAVAFGMLLGLVIEVGQFFIVSGVSQGSSVLTRVAGVVAGAALMPWWRQAGITGVREVLRRFRLLLWLAYLPLLAAASGLFSRAWHGLDGAAATWQSVRLLPFYYHYYTSEAVAMASLGSVALMYLPLAVLGWAGGASAPAILLGAGLLSVVVEGSKLWVDGLHPDPTNVLIAVASAALGLRLLALAQRTTPQPGAGAHADADGAVDGAQAGSPARSRRVSPWLLALPAAALGALWFPVWPAALLAVLAGCAALVWRWPPLALALLPAALPVWDLAPWSGRFFLDEFDLLSLVCVAVACHRTPPPARGLQLRPLTLAFGLLGLSLALSAVRGAGPPAWPDANSFSSYYSGWNALRIVKGAAWAWFFVHLWRRLDEHGARSVRWFGHGVLAGLALTIVVVVWERAVFASLWDFEADFRVSGAISAMHKGGAYIECWLAVAAAFALSAVLRPGSVWRRAGAALLLGGASYALAVTYSRNGYAALLAALVVGAACALVWHPTRPRLWLWGSATAALVLAIVLPVVGGSFAQQRLQKSGADLAVRQAHWQDGLALRDDSLLTTLFGVGLGRFPEAHFWRSQEALHAASFRIGQEGSQHFLRLAQGATLYIEQIVPRPAAGPLRLTLRLRSQAGSPTLRVTLCNKWGLTSARCSSGGLIPAAGGAQAPGAWQAAELSLDLPAGDGVFGILRAPLKLSLLTPAAGSVDVTGVQLTGPTGALLLANGDFSRGMDRWFFATDVDPPWHLHSLPVNVLFDQGWLGLLAWAALGLVALATGIQLVRRRQAQEPLALAALAAFLVSATLNTLIDSPRFLGLLLVLVWLAGAAVADPARARR